MNIDQEAIEYARLNARTKDRTEKAQQSKRENEEKEAERESYFSKSHKQILTYAGIGVAAGLGCLAGLIHPVISVPLGVFCLCMACVRYGVLIGKREGK